MSNIDKQAKSVIRELIDDARSRRLGKLIITADEMEALLDELEAVQTVSAARLVAIDTTHKMFQRERDRAEKAEKRIAEQRETLLAARSHVMQCARMGDAHAYGLLKAIDRAAMLQGAEPVTTAYKLPANTPCKDAPEHIWLQTAGVWPENGEFSELTWCSDNQHPDDTLYVRADVVTGNSPVISDDVRRMDWLVSKTVDVREPMVYGSHSIFWSQTTTDEEDDYHATKLREQIDAAMAAEQAAAPQQEVKP